MIDRREFLRRGGLAALGVTAMAAAGRGTAAAARLESLRQPLIFEWSRVQPEGAGPGNAEVLEHYSRRIDSMLEAGAQPMPTLFRRELPQPLLDAGGCGNSRRNRVGIG